MPRSLHSIRALIIRDEGATAVEYAVMLALVVAACAMAVSFLGNTSATNSFLGNTSATNFTSAASAAGSRGPGTPPRESPPPVP